MTGRLLDCCHVDIQDVEEDDFFDLAIIESHFFRNNEFARLTMGSEHSTPSNLEKRAALYRDAFQSRCEGKRQRWVKAVLPDGKIIGFASWTVPDVSTICSKSEKLTYDERNHDTEHQGGLLEYANLGLLRGFYGAIDEIETRYMEGQEYASIDILMVETTYQCQGVGAMLVSRGIADIDIYGVPIWVASSVEARNLYKKFQFQDLQVLEYSFENHGCLGSEKCFFMSKLAKA